MPEPTVLLLSTSDTDLISARSSGKNYRWANPSRLSDLELTDLLAEASIVVIRILGGYRAWQSGIDTVIAGGVPAVLVSGEQAADAELTDRSTVAAGTALQAHIYLAHGGVDNLRELHAFLCDTVLMTGFGFTPPVATPTWGVLERPDAGKTGPTIAVLYYRAQHLAGNTGYVEALCRAIEDAGGRPLPLYCASLRTAEPRLLERLGGADAMVVTVLAAGGVKPAAASAGGDDDSWNVEHLAALDIPILQGLCLTSPRDQWCANDDGRQNPTGEQELDLVLAILRARQLFGGAHAIPGLRQALGLAEDGTDERATVDQTEAKARELVAALQATGWDPSAADRLTGNADAAAVLRFAATEVIPRLAGTATEIEQVLRALDGRFIPAGPSGSPLRGLVNVLPTGRNFYSVDPKAVPSRLAWEAGVALADSLLARYRDEHGRWPRSVGLSVWGTSAMRTAGDDIAEVLALLGVRPVWDDASRRVIDLAPMQPAELGRPRIDVTVRISGFFRDAFPHVVTMLDDAVRLVADLDEAAEDNYVRAHAQADLAHHGDQRRATTRIFGSKPGTYGAGLLQLIDSRSWRDDADLAQVYTAWGGFAYGRDLDGREAIDDMNRQYRRIAVAAKNTDTREHDIADSDDYFQYHGGMVATVRALTGQAPAAYIGDNTRPDAIRTRTLSEETTRVFRARVVNPRWMAAMRRHGYKGAFEMAATVDYLFGYDATAGVMADWMYEQLTQRYVLDAQNRTFMTESNPWALHGMAERLLEAAGRGLWAQPAPETLDGLRQVLLETEGDLEA